MLTNRKDQARERSTSSKDNSTSNGYEHGSRPTSLKTKGDYGNYLVEHIDNDEKSSARI